MPIDAATARRAWEALGCPPLTGREGGVHLRARFAAWLALRHPDRLTARLSGRQADGPLAVEEAMLGCLDASAREGEWGLLAEWAGWDEDAYELLAGLP